MAVPGKGMQPLDSLEDFAKPTTVPGSVADEMVGHEEPPTPQEEQMAQGFVDKVKEPEQQQQQLPGMQAEATEEPSTVRHGQMYAKFIEAVLARDKDSSEPLLKFKFSFMLTPAHHDLLPEEVLHAWEIVKQGECKRYDIKFVPPQTLTINIDAGEVDLKIVGALIERPSIQVIEDTGSGKAKTGIRFSFTAITDRGDEATEFALKHDSDGVWITMTATQAKLN